MPKKSIEKLYAIEGRNPISIRIWLRAQGFNENAIDLAMAEYAKRIADGERFGYRDGISILSNRIRAKARLLTERDEEEVMVRLSHFAAWPPVWTRLWRVYYDYQQICDHHRWVRQSKFGFGEQLGKCPISSIIDYGRILGQKFWSKIRGGWIKYHKKVF